MLMVILQIFIFILFTITIVHYIIFTFLCTDIQTFHHHYIYIFEKENSNISSKKTFFTTFTFGTLPKF